MTYIIRQHISGTTKNTLPVPAPQKILTNLVFFPPNLCPNNTFLSFIQGNVTESSLVGKLSQPFLLNFLCDPGAHSEREDSGDSAVFYNLTNLGFYQGNI